MSKFEASEVTYRTRNQVYTRPEIETNALFLTSYQPGTKRLASMGKKDKLILCYSAPGAAARGSVAQRIRPG